MTNRREFLHGAALSALPAAAGAALAGAVRVRLPGPIDVHAVIVDSRHTQARTLGARLADSGAAVHALADGDVTQLWLRHIGPAWKRSPVGVAGLTEPPALFCLEQFAWSHGLRVVFHAEHIVQADGRTQHQVLRSGQGAACSTHELRRAGPLWPTVVADAFTAHRAAAARPAFGPSDAGLSPPLPAGAGLLTSWIIAAV